MSYGGDGLFFSLNVGVANFISSFVWFVALRVVFTKNIKVIAFLGYVPGGGNLYQFCFTRRCVPD